MKKKNHSKCKGWLVRNVGDLITTLWQGRVTGREVSRTLVVTLSLTSLSPACAREEIGLQNLTGTEWLDVTGLWRRSFTVRKKLQLLRVTQLEQRLDQGASRTLPTQAFCDSEVYPRCL